MWKIFSTTSPWVVELDGNLPSTPFGQVPAIKDDDFTIFESRANIKFLAEKYEGQGNNLLGKTLRERAVVEQWSQVEVQTFSPPCATILLQIVFAPMFGGKTDQAIVDTNSEKLGKVLDVYEERLSKSDYLAGDFFSVADLSHLSYLNYLASRSWNGSLPLLPEWWPAEWKRLLYPCFNVIDHLKSSESPYLRRGSKFEGLAYGVFELIRWFIEFSFQHEEVDITGSDIVWV